VKHARASRRGEFIWTLAGEERRVPGIDGGGGIQQPPRRTGSTLLVSSRHLTGRESGQMGLMSELSPAERPSDALCAPHAVGLTLQLPSSLSPPSGQASEPSRPLRVPLGWPAASLDCPFACPPFQAWRGGRKKKMSAKATTFQRRDRGCFLAGWLEKTSPERPDL
jgi:hypothetical protein